MSGPVRHLTCCCCGAYAGRWRQHWNRDRGFGVCAKCVEHQRSHPRCPADQAEIEESYGKEGINWGAADERVH